MSIRILALSLFALGTIPYSQVAAAEPPGAVDLSFNLPGATEVAPRENFDAGWRFALFGLQGDGTTLPEPEAQAPGFSDAQWRPVDIPHDWGIEGPFRIELPAQSGKRAWFGIGWYRKTFTLSAADQGRSIYLDFDGAMSDSTVFLNGEKVGGWPYGYTSFRVDLTGKLKFGMPNVVAVRLNNEPASSRWYPGGGLYRNVWLVKVNPVHVAMSGVFVTTPRVTAKEATVQVQVDVDNDAPAPVPATVEADLWQLGATPAKIASSAAPLQIKPGGTAACIVSAMVSAPALWDLDRPNLYCALITVRIGNKILDTSRAVFGIRTAQIDASRGLVLNGCHVPIRGVCLHGDQGALGTAFNVHAAERQLRILKALGCNSIRTSHNPPAPEFLDLCDRMGFLVLDEAFDTWAYPKTPNDYSRFFQEWHDRDITAFVRRDRNHPSVYLWSAGNEVSEQGKGLGTAQELVGIFHREDPTRLVTVACNNERVVSGFFRGMDVLGFNYKPRSYAPFHEMQPAVPVVGTETSSAISSRGVYLFSGKGEIPQPGSGFQVSSYDLTAVRWGNIPDVDFAAADADPFLIGEYVWTGFDYLGEPTPWNKDSTNLLNYHDEKSIREAKAELDRLGKVNSPSRSSYFGIIDLAGFPKDRYYLYQARWRPDLPMVHLLPHWNWPERVGRPVPVEIYTSGDEAELFLNGKSLGRKQKSPGEYRLRWDDVIYEPGELKAVAYKSGEPWSEETVTTTGPAAQLSVSVDRPVIAADGTDLAYVTVAVADTTGRIVPRSNNLVKITVSGPGRVVAVDNGDPTSLEPFIASKVKAFNGLCLAIVRSEPGQPGPIQITATSDGLRTGKLMIGAR